MSAGDVAGKAKGESKNAVPYWTLPGIGPVKRTIAVTFVIAIMYSSSFFMQMTLMPYIIKELGIDSVDFGYLQTTFGVVQLIGGPIFGQLCDSFGVRSSMILAFSSCAACYSCTFMATGYWGIFLSRVLGIFMHGIQGAQTILAGCTSGEERTIVYSRMGVVFGLGFILGPSSAGLLSKVLGHRAPLLFAVGLSFVAMTLTLKYIPERTDAAKNESKNTEKESKNYGIDWTSYRRVLGYPQVLKLFIIKNLAVIPFIVLTSIFALYLVEEYEVKPGQNSMLSVYVGLWVAFLNAYGIARIRRSLDELTLLRVGLVCFLCGYAGLSLVFSAVWQLYLINPFMAAAMSIVGVVSDSQITALVPGTEHGTVMGLSHAVNATFRTAAPLIAGYILKNCGFSAFGYMGILTTIASLLIITLQPLTIVEQDSSKKENLNKKNE